MDVLQQPGTPLDVDPDSVHEQYQRLGLGRLSDNELFDIAARSVVVPKRDPANSFCLHAPLELLARRALLGFVRPGPRRDAVRERMLWVAAKYRRMAEPAAAVAARSYASPTAACGALIAAVDRADLDGVDAAATWLATYGSDAAVAGLAPAVIDRLGAAGHASIYFSLFARVGASGRSARALLGPLVHELARMPELRVEWVSAGVETTATDGVELARALATTPRLGLPGSNFIFPIVYQVDSGGSARDLIGANLPHDVDHAARAILGVAALSMLQDDPASAPYGWTHCLTLPLGVLANTSSLPLPAVGLAIAATYVAGFRAALGARDVDLGHEPAPVAGDVIDGLSAEPNDAAAAAFHAPAAEHTRLVSELAAWGGAHEDAHVAKYTLACFDAASRDPERVNLYLAAAAYLQSWWRYATPEPVD